MRRNSARTLGLGVLIALTTGGATLAAVSAASAAPAPSVRSNPFLPQNGHAYRRGAVTTRDQHARIQSWASAHAADSGTGTAYGTAGAATANATAATGPQTLSYSGGVSGIGVTSGKPKVYLVFWGSQWGTSTANSSGALTFSNDSYGGAPKMQQLFKGLGTGGELWSGVMTQYCDGAGVAIGATSCPATATHVGYPTGGALAGVWYDNAAAEPTAATGNQLGTEAVKAAAHFGNTTAASNRFAQYVILSAKGLNPDNYKTGGFCAWHDWNGDVGAASSYGTIAFTNMPYVMDQGAGCGMNFVNSGTAGQTDGYTMVEGHEYAETLTDQNPAGGWINHTSSSYSGEENGDECSWLRPGTVGGAANVVTATGSFAEQATWSNDTNSCAISHPIVGSGTTTANKVTVTNPGAQTGTVGTAKTLQISATDSAAGQTLTYSATGLPAGLTINSTSGLISGTPTVASTTTAMVTVKDTTGASGSASFSWTIAARTTSCSGQKLGNPGFETGAAAPWSATAGVIDNTTAQPARTGLWKAWLDGYGTTHTDTLAQSVSIPAGCHATLAFYLHIDTAEAPASMAYDTLTVKVGTTVVATYSNLNSATGYTLRSFDVSAFAGQTVTLGFTGVEDQYLPTSFVIDDASVTLS